MKNKTTNLLALFRHASKIRNVELRIAKEYPQGEMRCPVHLSVGQELISACFATLVQAEDYAVSGHRGHAHYLAKGGDLNKMIAEIYGKATGCSQGRGGSMHLADASVNFMGTSAIVGNSIPVGVGLGLGLKIQKKPGLSFIFFGDGAVEEGAFYEAVNFAIVAKLPVIFICENNGFSVYSDFTFRQPENRNIKTMVESMGIRSISLDGVDPLSNLDGLKNAIEFSREHALPGFVEIKTSRFLEHCGPNDDSHLGYRSEFELREAIAGDPLARIKSLLTECGVEDLEISKIIEEIDFEIDAAFAFAKHSPLSTKKEAASRNEMYA